MYGCIDGPTLPSRRRVAPPSSCLAFSRLVVSLFGRFAALPSCYPVAPPSSCLAVFCCLAALLRAYCLIASMAEIFVALRAG